MDNLAPRAILAQCLFDQMIQLVALERDFICGAIFAVAGHRQFASRAWRRRDPIPRAGRHQLGDFAGREQLRRTRVFRSQQYLGEMFDGLQIGRASCRERV